NSLHGIVNRLTTNASLDEELFEIGLILLWKSEKEHPEATESWHLQGCDFDLHDHLEAGHSLDAHKHQDLACQIDDQPFLEAPGSFIEKIIADDLLEELCAQLEPLDCVIIRAL